MPHLVRQGSNGQYQCDDKCINWTTSGICSHSIAVAELNHDLDKFLRWYNTAAAEGLRLNDYSVPMPPFDLVVSRAERRQFRDR